MSAVAEANKSTLVELFKNLGPGLEHWFQAYEKALTPDCTWWMQGWPLVAGFDELKNQVHLLNRIMDAHANPILDWRCIDAQADGSCIYFERRGAFSDESGNIIIDWDIMGVFNFNQEGKIFSIRDYFDNSAPYGELRKTMPEEKIQEIFQLGRATHPLNEDHQLSKPFYASMLADLEVG